MTSDRPGLNSVGAGRGQRGSFGSTLQGGTVVDSGSGVMSARSDRSCSVSDVWGSTGRVNEIRLPKRSSVKFAASTPPTYSDSLALV